MPPPAPLASICENAARARVAPVFREHMETGTRGPKNPGGGDPRPAASVTPGRQRGRALLMP
jgi:hypothetical protein